MISKHRLTILETQNLSWFHTSDLQQHIDIIKYCMTNVNPYDADQRRYLSRIIERIENELAERVLFAESNNTKKEVTNESTYTVFYRLLRRYLSF